MATAVMVRTAMAVMVVEKEDGNGRDGEDGNGSDVG